MDQDLIEKFEVVHMQVNLDKTPKNISEDKIAGLRKKFLFTQNKYRGFQQIFKQECRAIYQNTQIQKNFLSNKRVEIKQ